MLLWTSFDVRRISDIHDDKKADSIHISGARLGSNTESQ